MSISITTPANDGDPFPNTITGAYADFIGHQVGVGPLISVLIKNQGTGSQDTYPATVVPGPGRTSGTWSLAKPGNLSSGAKYTITATLGSDTATVIDIQN